MVANHVLLQRITTSTSAASVTFSNIPQSGYTDLKLVMSARTAEAVTYATPVKGYFNGSNSSLTYARLYNSNGGTGADTGAVGWFGIACSANQTAGVFSNAECYIPNYLSSNNKIFYTDSVSESNAANDYQNQLTGSTWASSAAINSITLVPNASSFIAGCTFSLYGVATVGTTPVISPYASGGDIVQTDGTYWYHAFLSSGSFVPIKSLSCDLLVVAGGGGAGYYYGAGGGAGGLLLGTGKSVASGISHTVTIGAGGTGQNSSSGSSPVNGANGNNSVFSDATALGGGGGAGGDSNTNPTSGGSSGGKRQGTASAATQGNSGGLTGYGNAGSVLSTGGGGGGAGAAGSSGNGGNGAGGTGFTNYAILDAMGTATSTGLLSSGHYYYAGGGGSYNGSSGTNGLAGGSTANLGGGGTGDSGNGGSGLVIIRYAV